ncbi:MAG: preprotein translocase subunit YajC [Verrucomicrobiales bacterium]
MITLLALLAQSPAPAGNPSSSSGLMSFLPIILMFVIFYFIAIRPQRKKQQELAAQISALKGGDHIVTTGGIYGIVSSLQEKTLTLKIADNVKIKIDKTAVAGVVKKSADADVIEVPAEESKA